MKIDSIEEAEEILQNYIPNVSKYNGDDLSLDRMYPMLEALGNPHEKLKIIHIAGTGGKTSTAYFITSILVNSGLKTGLTVSPHVDSITERIQINSVPLSEHDFCRYLGDFLEIISDTNQKPSYFELLIAFVYWVFAEEQVDYAVIETGMGGLLDSTNVAERSDKVCVITDIGFDHMHVLGNTISEIAFQKAGIIHEGNQIFMYGQTSEVMDQVMKVVKQKNANLQIIQDTDLHQSGIENASAPLFQKRNWNLARQVCLFVSKRDEWPLGNVLNTLQLTVPGRMETVELKDGTILIMDGAHNGRKIVSFTESFKEKYPNRKTAVLLALKTGKEYIEVIDILSGIANSFIFTTFSTSQDLPAVSQDPEILNKYSKQKKIPSKVIVEYDLAYKELLKSASEIKLIIGSFYLLGQIRKIL